LPEQCSHRETTDWLKSSRFRFGRKCRSFCAKKDTIRFSKEKKQRSHCADSDPLAIGADNFIHYVPLSMLTNKGLVFVSCLPPSAPSGESQRGLSLNTSWDALASSIGADQHNTSAMRILKDNSDSRN
jgi:hypothetical protein